MGEQESTNDDTDRGARGTAGPIARIARWFGTTTRGLFAMLAVVYLLMAVGIGYAFADDGVRRIVGISIAAIVIGVASACIGSLVGFTFAIPRALQSTAPTDSERLRTRYAANTNFEQISDWLTKILVGISLVQIGSVPSYLSRLANCLSPLLGDKPQSGGVGIALCLASLLGAFLVAYLWTRTTLTSIFSAADRQAEEESRVGSQRRVAEAIASGYEPQLAEALKARIDDPQMAMDIMNDTRQKVKQSAITIDLRPIEDRLGQTSVTLAPDATVSSLLDFVYLALPRDVTAYSYGKEWLLRRQDGSKTFTDIGTLWARESNMVRDQRPLDEVGIHPGDELEVIRGPVKTAW